MLLALEDNKDEPSGALVAKKAKTVPAPAVKKAKVSKSKKRSVRVAAAKAVRDVSRQPARWWGEKMFLQFSEHHGSSSLQPR